MGIVLAAGTVFMFVRSIEAGVSLERARTVALTTMVFFQFYQDLNCRSETQSVFIMSLLKKHFLFFSMVAAFFAQLAVIYVPALRWVFRTVPLSGNEWIGIAVITVTVLAAVEIDKAIRKKRYTDIMRLR